jgi:protein-S-isoprenylcysteine O-methyltransferase Ste14
MRHTDMLGSMMRTLLSFGGWAALHSLLATPRAKALAGGQLGEDRRNAVYRVSYNTFAVFSLIALVCYVRRLPDQRLYRIPWPFRALTGTMRLLLLLVAVRAALEVGLGPFSGFSELIAYVSRRTPPHEPEAQGPAMGSGGLRVGGPFRYVRHPLNASLTGIVLLTPVMTWVRLTVVVLTAAYSILGSMLEEERLLAQYGQVYEEYRRSGVPFFLPSFSSKRDTSLWTGRNARREQPLLLEQITASGTLDSL